MPFSSRLYLYKRSNGFYYIGYFERGRLRWKSTKSKLKSDALKALTDFRELLRAKPKVVTLSGFRREFLDFARITFARQTAVIYELSFRYFEAVAGNPCSEYVLNRNSRRIVLTFPETHACKLARSFA